MAVLGDRPGRHVAGIVAGHDDGKLRLQVHDLLEHRRLLQQRVESAGHVVTRAHAELSPAVVTEARALDDAG